MDINTNAFLKGAVGVALRGIKKGWGGPFGAVIVRKGKIVARTCNTVLKTNDPTCHAEINAIRIASRKMRRPFLTDCRIYSTTEPCPMCFAAIHWAKIPVVYFATRIPDVKKLGFNELTISNEVMKRLGKSNVKLIHHQNDDCDKLLKAWARMPKKKTY